MEKKKKIPWMLIIVFILTIFSIIQAIAISNVGRVSNGFLIREKTALWDTADGITSSSFLAKILGLILFPSAVILSILKKHWRNLLIILICGVISFIALQIVMDAYHAIRGNPMRREKVIESSFIPKQRSNLNNHSHFLA